MMKQTILALILLSIMYQAVSQTKTGNSITGTVISGATGQPLEYATVSIFHKGEKTAFNGTTTDNAGVFVLPDIPEGSFTLVIESIGYTPYTKANLLLKKKDAIIDLKKISLALDQSLMEGVTISNKTKLVENKIDKIVFNAEKDVSSQGGVATDVLKKVPQVSVDADGNVQLAGSSGIRFLINGKPSAAFGSNIADVLQSIPSSQIKSIEVITNPGAKYDAQGLGGIINIILKKNNSKGYNANISVTAGTRNENASLNLNVRHNDFGVNAFFSGNKRLRSDGTNESHRVTTDSVVSFLDQESSTSFERQGYQTGVGFDWSLKKHNDFTGNISYNSFEFNRGSSTYQSLQPDRDGGMPAILSLINAGNRYRYHSVDASLNYKRTFEKDDQELEMSVSTNSGNNRGNSYSLQYALPGDSLFYGNDAYNPANTRETILSIDYTQPIQKDVRLGIGTKATLYNIESDAAVNSYHPVDKIYQPDAFLSNGLTYDQKVYAAYAELTFPVGKLFDAKIGGRYERTEVDATYTNAGGQVNVPGYNTFVPSLFFSKKIGDNQTLKLSFSKRINRPDYRELNPFVNTTDPKNLSTGNPYLQPELGYRYELGYSHDIGKGGSFMVNLFFRVNDNDIQPYIVYYPQYYVGDSLYSNVSVSTRQNIGRENNAGLNLFADLHPTAKLSLRSNAFFYYRHTINAIDVGYNSNSFNYRFNVNASYEFTNTIVAELFGHFHGPRNEAQGRYPAFSSYTLALRKQFWHKKASIALTATNLFKENLTQQTVLKGNNFTHTATRSFVFRSIGINFTWRFGKLEFKKKNDEGGDSNLNPPMQQ